jgi:5'-3' exonuclease
MILIDMNQVMISNLMVHLTQNKEIDDGLVRHMVLNSLRMFRSKFYKDYGELVLCYDSKSYWRKKVFPFYKGTRKRDREKSSHNWSNIFDTLNKLRDEFRDNLPYPIMDVDGAEADDIIAVLCKYQGAVNIRLQKDLQPPVKVLILSGDKDFIQLQKYKFVKQYNPIQKKFISGIDPKIYILEHTIKGDRSDGIPNFLSEGDTFVENKRQKPLSKKNIERWLGMSPEEFCRDAQTLEQYNRNKQLIDFTCIPEEIEQKIIDSYESITLNRKGRLYEYFIKNSLSELLDKIGDF